MLCTFFNIIYVVYIVLICFRCSTVFAIQVSTRSFIQTESTWRAPQYGYHNRRFSLVDVERSKFLIAIPLCRLLVPVVQCLCSVYLELLAICYVARKLFDEISVSDDDIKFYSTLGTCFELHVLCVVCWQHCNYGDGNS